MSTSRRLRLLHLAMDGDTSGYFPQLARYHDRARYDMTIATLQTMTPELRVALGQAGVEAVSLGARSRAGYPVASLKLAALLKRHGIEILHTHLFDPSVVGLSTGWVTRVPVRVLTRHHSDYHTRIDKRWHVQLDRLCTALSHRVIVVSEHTRRVMVDQEHAPPERVVVIHNGIDLARVPAPPAADVAALRSELGLEGRIVLAVVARLHPEKGHHHLFRAMPRIVKATSGKVALVVVGTGPSLEEYRREVGALGLASAVQFLGFRTDVHRIYAMADVVVLPSVAEAFGLVLAEAMALERPIVATTAGGIPEVVEHGKTGWLVEPGASEALAEGVLALLADESLRRRLGAAGRASVEERFRFDAMMRRYEDLYEQLAAERLPGMGA